MNDIKVYYKKLLNLFLSRVNLKGITKGDKIIELYIIAVFILSPLFLFDVSFFQISIKAELLLFVTIITASAYIYLISRKQLIPRRAGGILDICMFCMFLLSFIVMGYKLVSRFNGRRVSYEAEIVTLTLIITYFLVSCAHKGYHYYLKLLLSSSVFVYAGLIYHFMFNPQFIRPIELLTDNPQNVTSYMVLITTISTLLYCTAKEKRESICYMLISGIGFFLLFLSNNIIGICIIGVLFLLIPVMFIPTAVLIKRDMHMLFLFFIILSNMSLVTDYAKWIKVNISFDIATSIYIDLFLSAVAICYLRYWEKIPENIDLHRSVMRKLQKTYIFMLRLTGIFFLVILLAGEKWKWIPQSFGVSGLGSFISEFQRCLSTRNGTFYDALAEYGIAGFLLLLIICILIINKLKENYDKNNQFSVILTVIAIVFLVQSAFFRQQLIVTPIYVILLTLALLHYKEKRGKPQ